MALPSGISRNDFTRGPLKDWGRNITYYAPVKVTDNDSQAESTSWTTPSTIFCVFQVRRVTEKLTPHGLVKLSDAYIMALPESGIREGGLIVDADGRKFVIHHTVRRPNASNPMFDFGECYLQEDVVNAP